MKVLPCDILKSGMGSVLNKFHSRNEVNLISTKDVKVGGVEYDDLDERSLVGIFKDRFFGKEIYRAFPVDRDGNKDNSKWWMFGGTFLITSDDRFPLEYPVKIMDRCED